VEGTILRLAAAGSVAPAEIDQLQSAKFLKKLSTGRLQHRGRKVR